MLRTQQAGTTRCWNKSGPFNNALLKGAGSVLQKLTWLRGLFESHVPIGYEDENGFHFGPKPTVPSVPPDN